VNSRIQVQLEEDGNDSSEQIWMWRIVVCGLNVLKLSNEKEKQALKSLGFS